MELAEGPRRELMEDASRPSDDGREVPRSRPLRWGRRIMATILWVAVLGLAVLTLGPSFLSFRSHAVVGSSMEPTIPYRSLAVYSSAAAADLEVGDIIAFHPPGRPERLVTHRIVGEEMTPQGLHFVTRGDANGAPDDWLIPAAGSGWRYELHVPLLGYLQFALATPVARAVLVSVAALAFAAWALVRIWRPRSSRGGG